jgi:hypothetical protein
MFNGPEQKGAKATSLRIDTSDALAVEQTGEKFLREIAGGIFIGGIAANEGENRRVVGRAQLTQRLLCARRVAARLDDARPMRRGEGFRMWRR